MQYQKIDNQTFVVRIERGEEIIASLQKFCQKESIVGGFFYGIGAVDKVELAHYDVATKKYSSKKFTQALELTNLTGNVGQFENNLIIHAHASLADKKMTCLGGHLVKATVSGTAEIYFIQAPSLKKNLDEETGLKLFCLEKNL